MKKDKILIFVIIFFALLSFCILEQPLDKITARLDFLIKNFPHEKVYIQTDKPHYLIGDTIWFSAFVTDAAFLELNPVSSLLYVQVSDSDDNTIRKIKIKLSGKYGNGYIPLNNAFDAGSHTIQAYTAYQLNYDKEYLFSKEIQIWSDAKIDQLSKEDERKTQTEQSKIKNLEEFSYINFYPEGNMLVDGLESVIAYEVLDFNGSPLDKPITIFDDNDSIIVQSKVLYNGKGFFNLRPKHPNKYYAKINGTTEKIALPQIKRKGHTLQVVNRSSTYFSITIKTNMPEGLDSAILVCHIRGDVFFTKDKIIGDSYTIKINKNELTSGVGQIILFDKNGIPIAERSIYISNPNETPDVQIEMPYAYLLPKSKADVTVLVTDKNGNPIKGSFCVSVIDINKVNYSPYDENITSYFLLTSDLKKSISKPGELLSENSAKKTAIIDLEMMTQQWSRISQELLCSDNDPILNYGPEHGLTIRGSVLKNGKPKENLKVDLSILEGGIYVDETITDNFGRFAFYDVHAVKGQTIHVKAYELRPGQQPNNSNIKLILENINDYKTNTLMKRAIHWTELFKPNDFLATSLEKVRMDELFSEMTINLEEINIKAKRISRNQELSKNRDIIYGTPQKRMELDSMPLKNPNWNVLEFVAFNTAGARLVGLRGPNQSIRLSGSPRQGPPLILLDGAPININTALALDINSLEFIDVITRLSGTAIYGDQAEGGVIALYNKRGNSAAKLNALENVAKYIADGVQDYKAFHSFDYSKSSFSKPDIRTTEFWSPSISTDDDGIAKFSFYTSNNTSKYLIKIEGMTIDGRPFNKNHNFVVKAE